MSGLILPPGVEIEKKKRKHHAIRMCVVQLNAEGPKDEDPVWCDIIAMVDIGPIRAKTNMGQVIVAAYAIPEEERAVYYVKDMLGKKMSKDANDEHFALSECREFFQATAADCEKMAEGAEILSARSGVAYFVMHGVLDNPIYEPKLMKGLIKILFMRW